MKINLFNQTIAVFAVAALSLTACKTGSDASEFIKHITITKDAQTFEYSTTFSQNVEIDMEAEFPIGQYGFL
jgi:outer membrane lipoprotein SlyB